jgi:hypothetical protein
MNTLLQLLLTASLLIFANGVVWATDGYVCVTDIQTGFAFDKEQKRWHQANFEAEAKYVISKASRKDLQTENLVAAEDETLVVKSIGASIPVSVCRKGFEKTFDKDDEAHCEGVIHFKMSRRLLRFLAVSSHGYWKYDAMATEGYFLPTMSIGKCSPL